MTISLDFFRSFTRVIKIPRNIKEVHQLSLAVLELFVIYSIYSLGVTQTATGTIYVQVSGGNKTSQDFGVHIIVTSGQGCVYTTSLTSKFQGKRELKQEERLGKVVKTSSFIICHIKDFDINIKSVKLIECRYTYKSAYTLIMFT